MPPEYVVFRDLPTLLGVSRGAAHRYVTEPKLKFPKPNKAMTAAMGMRVWNRSEVMEWKRQYKRPKVGRPLKRR